VPIVTAVVTRIAGRREALLRVDPHTAAAFTDAASVDLRWDEERGWRCVVSYPTHLGLADRSIDAEGVELAHPTAVAGWVAAVLAGRDWAGDEPQYRGDDGQAGVPQVEYVEAAA